ncbi:MAG: PAC2 family protein [Candidatus Bathyarchaeota archaeon]|nr:PAC2 family protein [Candidatus Bathyarchaeota archaeon]
MTCIVKLYKQPQLEDPFLIEGLPGIGLVANLATSFLIKELNAKLFGEAFSSSFQGVAITKAKGELGFPASRLYYHKRRNGERDLILLYGTTQALTTRGQYELCWRLLETVETLGCRQVITLGGYRPGREVTEPRLYYAASDAEMALEAEGLEAENLKGRIFGVAGLLVGLCRPRGMRGYCLLAETPGDHPDKVAAREILRALTTVLHLTLDLSKEITPLEAIAESKSPKLEPPEDRKASPRWFV